MTAGKSSTPVAFPGVMVSSTFTDLKEHRTAQPPYIASHEFVGRQAQLEKLSTWAAAADPRPVLLFDAIGGAGKSMVAWEWTLHHAPKARTDWAGRFWYSFYEKGAVMEDFCRRALTYTASAAQDGSPVEDFRTRKMAELTELLIRQLRKRPWLFVLDGLERVLVAYHRFDAAQVADEEAGRSDEIVDRDPYAAIRPEDEDLLRVLAAATPSKLLITSRLVPRVLLNPSGQAIPGVLHERLPGLDPGDAEALLRSCGVTGNSQAIQSYLKKHCDCHPLVTGVLAGLINDYLPARGNFDAWATARNGGAALNLAELDLRKKQNHILRAALEALPEKSRQLLSTLALLPEAVDYRTLAALTPQSRPARQEEKPYRRFFARAADEPEEAEVDKELTANVRDLERRGLLQYDKQRQFYDLHPVVRGIAARGLRQEGRDGVGQRVVDHFSRQHHDPYAQAETVDDLSNGLHVVRTLLQMNRYRQAADAYSGDLAETLLFSLGSAETVLTLIKPFFPEGWGTLPSHVGETTASYLANHAGIALGRIGEESAALATLGTAIELDLQYHRWHQLWAKLSNFSSVLLGQHRIAAAESSSILALDLATLVGQEEVFSSRLDRVHHLAVQGRWSEAEAMWRLVEPMSRSASRPLHRVGEAELTFVLFRFWQGTLNEEHLARAEKLANASRNKDRIRELHRLRGAWLMEQRRWEPAAASLREALHMAHKAGKGDSVAETQLALARYHLGRLADPRGEAELLLRNRYRSSIDLAAFWLAIGDREQAKTYALAAYEWAWADGEPYVFRYGLNRARTLLEKVGAEIPRLPRYDPAGNQPFPWEKNVRSAITLMRSEEPDEPKRPRPRQQPRKTGRKRKVGRR